MNYKNALLKLTIFLLCAGCGDPEVKGSAPKAGHGNNLIDEKSNAENNEPDLQSGTLSRSPVNHHPTVSDLIALQREVESLKEQLNAKEKNKVKIALRDARDEFASRNMKHDYDDAKRAHEIALVDLDNKVAMAGLPDEVFEEEGRQIAARERGFRNAAPTHRRIKNAMSDGAYRGIELGTTEVVGSGIVRAVDWFWNGVYYNIPANKKRRDQEQAAQARDERIVRQRVNLINNSRDLAQTAQATDATKKLFLNDFESLNAEKTQLIRMQSLGKRLETEKRTEEECNKGIAETKLKFEQAQSTGEKRAKQSEIEEFEKQKAISQKRLSELLDELEAHKGETIIASVASHQDQVETLRDLLQHIERELKIAAANNDAKKQAELLGDAKKLEESLRALQEEGQLLGELSTPKPLEDVLNSSEKINLLGFMLAKNKALKDAEIAEAKERSRRLSSQLLKRLTHHNNQHEKLNMIDEDMLDHDLRSMMRNDSDDAEAAASAAA